MTGSGYMDSRYKREVAALAAMEESARLFGKDGPSPALLKRQRQKVRELRAEHKAMSAARRTPVPREVSFDDARRWPTTPAESIPSDASGVVVYDPGLDVVLCVPCQRLAGPEGHTELMHPRPATSSDMRRLTCCSSCGRDFRPALAS